MCCHSALAVGQHLWGPRLQGLKETLLPSPASRTTQLCGSQQEALPCTDSSPAAGNPHATLHAALFWEHAGSLINPRHSTHAVRYIIIKIQSKNSNLITPLNNYGLFTFFHILASALCDDWIYSRSESLVSKYKTCISYGWIIHIILVQPNFYLHSRYWKIFFKDEFQQLKFKDRIWQCALLNHHRAVTMPAVPGSSWQWCQEVFPGRSLFSKADLAGVLPPTFMTHESCTPCSPLWCWGLLLLPQCSPCGAVCLLLSCPCREGPVQ